MTPLNEYTLVIVTESDGEQTLQFTGVKAGFDLVNGFVQVVPEIGTLKVTRLPEDWTQVRLTESPLEVPEAAPVASPEAEAIVTP